METSCSISLESQEKWRQKPPVRMTTLEQPSPTQWELLFYFFLLATFLIWGVEFVCGKQATTKWTVKNLESGLSLPGLCVGQMYSVIFIVTQPGMLEQLTGVSKILPKSHSGITTSHNLCIVVSLNCGLLFYLNLGKLSKTTIEFWLKSPGLYLPQFVLLSELGTAQLFQDLDYGYQVTVVEWKKTVSFLFHSTADKCSRGILLWSYDKKAKIPLKTQVTLGCLWNNHDLARIQPTNWFVVMSECDFNKSGSL